MYQYKLRPSAGGDYFLLEFPNGPSQENFIEDFTTAIALFNPEILEKGAGINPNDEWVYRFNCILGEFYLSVDIWQIAFLTASKEELLLMIDSRLLHDSLFEKIN